MTRAARALAVSIAVLLAVALAAVALQPLRDLRSDVRAQRHLLDEQLAATRDQLDALRQELAAVQSAGDAVRRSQADTTALLTATQALLVVARGLASDVAATRNASTQTRALAAQLVATTRDLDRLARATEQHVASIDRKTPSPAPSP